MKQHTLKTWEIALAAALCITVCTGLWAGNTQDRLSKKLVRLHVIGASDSSEDQATKLRMRDEVLAILSPALKNCQTQEDAAAVIRRCTPELEALGDVTVTLTEEYYPTRVYDTFSLPAGDYLSLQIRIGAAAGRNWWCVVFPPLCTEAVAEPAEDAFYVLSEEETGLITESTVGYVLRFRVVDWWETLTHRGNN